MESGNILICEDERLVARDIQFALERNGYTVAGIASDAEQAMRLAQEHAPDLALMDIRLRGSLSGIEIASILLDEFAVPSIFLTAYADDETLQQAKATLPLSYLLKPFDETQLKAALEIGLFRHREQKSVVSRLESKGEQMHDADTVQMAIELEREFMNVERINSNLQVGGNIARRVREELSMVNLLIDDAASGPGVDEDMRNELRGALIHQDRALTIIDRLLKCSEPRILTLEELSIESVVQAAFAEVTSRGPRVQFIDCLSPEEHFVEVDRNLAHEALVNVFLNAFQAMPESTSITVQSLLTYDEFPERFNPRAVPGWYVSVKVSDAGRGMERSQLERIFEPCFSVAATPVSVGLGMCTVHSIMQQHLGWVQVDSRPKAGTTVTLHFPSADIPNRRASNFYGHA